MPVPFPVGFLQSGAAIILPPPVPALLTTGSGAPTATLGTVTPTANAQLFLTVGARRGGSSGAPSLATFVDDGGLVWTQIADRNTTTSAGIGVRITVFTALAPAVPVPITLSVNCVTVARVMAALAEVPVASSNLANVNTAVDAAGSPVPTLAITPLSDSMLLAAAAVALVENAVPLAAPLNTPAGYTNLVNFSAQTSGTVNALGFQLCYLPAAGIVNSAVWSNPYFNSAAVITEVKHA